MPTTLSALRTQVRQQADMVGSTFITDSELNTYISSSYAELYDLLVASNEDYYVTALAFTISSGNTYSLPSDFYKLRGVDYTSGSRYITLKTYNFQERNKYQTSVRASTASTERRYHLTQNTLYIQPSDNAAGTYQLWYVPKPSALSLDADTVEGIAGWERYIVVDAAIKCLAKEESDTSALAAMKAEMKQRIKDMAAQRDKGMPKTISLVRNTSYDDEDYFY